MVYNVPAWRFFMAGVRFIDPVAGVCLWWFYSGLTAAFFCRCLRTWGYSFSVAVAFDNHCM